MVIEYAPQFDVDLLSARVVKLVDTRDLKSLALWVCRFDSGSGHQQIYFHSPATSNPNSVLKWLRTGFINSRFSNPYPKCQCYRIATL